MFGFAPERPRLLSAAHFVHRREQISAAPTGSVGPRGGLAKRGDSVRVGATETPPGANLHLFSAQVCRPLALPAGDDASRGRCMLQATCLPPMRSTSRPRLRRLRASCSDFRASAASCRTPRTPPACASSAEAPLTFPPVRSRWKLLQPLLQHVFCVQHRMHPRSVSLSAAGLHLPAAAPASWLRVLHAAQPPPRLTGACDSVHRSTDAHSLHPSAQPRLRLRYHRRAVASSRTAHGSRARVARPHPPLRASATAPVPANSDARAAGAAPRRLASRAASGAAWRSVWSHLDSHLDPAPPPTSATQGQLPARPPYQPSLEIGSTALRQAISSLLKDRPTACLATGALAYDKCRLPRKDGAKACPMPTTDKPPGPDLAPPMAPPHLNHPPTHPSPRAVARRAL